MLRGLVLGVVGLALVFGIVPRGVGQVDEEKKAALNRLIVKAEEEYRLYFRRPERPLQFWGAVTFEMESGKYDLAAFHLDKLLKIHLDPNAKIDEAAVDAAFLQIEEAKGLQEFLRLQNVPEKLWSDNVDLRKEAKENVILLVNRVTRALDRKLKAPERINKFLKALEAKTIEERVYALGQLLRSRQFVAPYLVDHLRATTGTVKHQRLMANALKLDPEIFAPMIEALKAADDKDFTDADLRPSIIELMRLGDERSAVPNLWHVAGSKKYPDNVRAKAREALASLLQTSLEKLEDPKVALTALAEKHRTHQVHFKDPRRVLIWPWNGKELGYSKEPDEPRGPVALSARQADLYFGLRYARQALDLAPAYKPAQLAVLNLLLEAEVRTNFDQALSKPLSPSMIDLLATLDSDLLIDALEQGMRDRDLTAVLPLVKALGDRVEVRAAQPSGGPAKGLIKALYYPDRRVQWLALRALLKLPSARAPVESGRIVDLLRRNLDAGTAPKVVAAYVPEKQAALYRKAFEGAGLTAVFVPDRKGLFEEVRKAADVEVVLIHYDVPSAELSMVLSALRQDVDAGLLPVFVMAPSAPPEKEIPVVRDQLDPLIEDLQRKIKLELIEFKDVADNPRLSGESKKRLDALQLDLKGAELKKTQILRAATEKLVQADLFVAGRVDALKKVAAKYRNVQVVGEGLIVGPKETKAAVEDALKFALTADGYFRLPERQRAWLTAEIKDSGGQKTSPGERQLYRMEAMEILWFMSQGKFSNFDLRPAQDAVLKAAADKDLAVPALEVLGRLPGVIPQQALAGVALDPARDKVRITAALELNRHVVANGLLLGSAFVDRIKGDFADPKTDPALRQQLAFFLSRTGSNPRLSGLLLKDFEPGPAPKAPEKEKKGE